MTSPLKKQLLLALESWGIDPSDLADENRSLIGAGLLDSLALFNLSVWLEDRIGRPIDPARLDVLTEWDSIASILRFIEHQGIGGAQAVPRTAAAPAPVAVPLPRNERYHIVRYDPSYRAEVARLLRGLWSPDVAVNSAVFHWKYEANPFAGEPLIYLALRDGHAVAMRAFCRSAWEADPAHPAHDVYVADDFVVEEQDRNHGLFNLFSEAALADLRSRGESVFFSLSALRVTRLQLLASGSRSVGVLPTIAWRPHWLRLADALTERLAKAPVVWRLFADRMPGEKAQRSFERLDNHPWPTVQDGLQITSASTPPVDELAALVAGIKHDGRLRHKRDSNFFGWRYRHPLHAYRFLLARRQGRLVAYIVLQRGLSAFANPRRVNIVDWACERNDDLRTVLRSAREAGRLVDLVTWAPASDQTVFSTLGFRSADHHQASRGLPCVMIRTVDPSEPSGPNLGGRPLLEPASWDLRMAYTSFA